MVFVIWNQWQIEGASAFAKLAERGKGAGFVGRQQLRVMKAENICVNTIFSQTNGIFVLHHVPSDYWQVYIGASTEVWPGFEA